MKIKPSRLRLTINYSIGAILIALLIFVVFFKFFTSSWSVAHIIITSCYFLSVGVLYFLTIKTTFYVIDKKHFSFFRWGKELRYFYSDIVFIDTSKGEKDNTLSFFTNKGQTIYLTTDKQGKLYNEVLTRCDHLLSYEDAKRKFPKMKI